MYAGTSTEFNKIIAGNSRHFFCKLVYKNEELTKFRSVKLTQQSIPDTDSFTIGGTISSVLEVEMDKPKTLITGKEFKLFFGLEVSGEVEWCPMCVVTAEKPKEDAGIITFTAYDRMVTAFNFPYYTSIKNYPVDAKEILKEISSKTGVAIANIDSLPDGIMIHQIVKENETTGKNVTVNPFAGYSYREAIKYIAQLYGTFATMNRDGKLEFRWYKKMGYTVKKNRSYDDLVVNEEEYEVQRIVCASAKIAVPGMDGGMILYVLHGPVENRDGIITAGSGPTGITLENPVMEVTLMEKLWPKIKGFKFTPATVSFLGDCRLDLGDIVTVEAYAEEIELPIMSISYEFDGGLTTEIGSYGSTEMQETSANVSPTDRMVSYVKTEILQVKEVLANKVSTEYLEANYATIKSLDAVEAKINEITATDITVEYLKAHYAQIDMANVDVANIRQGFLENLMVSQGIIADRVVGTEVVATEVLTGVNIYANDITAGTLSVDRLVLRGTEKSLVYALNNSGELESTEVDTLDANILTDRTITADKIVAGAITATEIDVKDLVVTGLIGTNKLTAQNVDVNDLFAQNITASGFIQSENYVKDKTGMKLTMSTGVWDSKCFKVNLEGEITATGGNIGGFSIGTQAIYKGTNSKTSTAEGIYLGTDALRAYTSENAYTHIENGRLSCVGASIKGDIHCTGSFYLYSTAYNRDWEVLSVDFSTEDNQLVMKDLNGHAFLEYHEDSGLQLYNFNAGTIYASDWFRSTGKTGWYNQTYGGGWYMSDKAWIKTYGGKGVYLDNTMRLDLASVNQVYNLLIANGKSLGFRNDGSSFWMLVSDTPDSYFNGLRPFSVSLSTGAVTMQNGYSTSDERLKKDLVALDVQACYNFIRQLEPIEFSWKNSSPGKHFGFSAQKVKELMEKLGFDSDEYGLVIESEHLKNGEDDNMDTELALGYNELIAPIISALQKVMQEVEELKKR